MGSAERFISIVVKFTSLSLSVDWVVEAEEIFMTWEMESSWEVIFYGNGLVVRDDG